ncbi:hypothetical protein [Cellulomonas iranensis]|uniref:hypothetical protein n=1 Tax=Cellulomonas iranensis TaxID=76862 RepID=UPI00299F1457|nr:hypothetical protein [Cellulomonas iranensis]
MHHDPDGEQDAREQPVLGLLPREQHEAGEDREHRQRGGCAEVVVVDPVAPQHEHGDVGRQEDEQQEQHDGRREVDELARRRQDDRDGGGDEDRDAGDGPPRAASPPGSGRVTRSRARP